MLPQFQDKILRQFLVIVSMFSSIYSPMLSSSFISLVLFSSFSSLIPLLPKVPLVDAELLLGSRFSWLLPERRLFVSCVKDFMVRLQIIMENIITLAERYNSEETPSLRRISRAKCFQRLRLTPRQPFNPLCVEGTTLGLGGAIVDNYSSATW